MPIYDTPSWDSTYSKPAGCNQIMDLDCSMEKNPVYMMAIEPKCKETEEVHKSGHVYEAL